MEEFEEWIKRIGNPYLLSKRANPAVWGANKEQIQQWKDNPYEHPYTRGAYEAWKFKS